MRVVAIVNQKGGCGKTTTAVNLAAVFARDGVRTLLVDMDPQSHCAAGLGVPDQRIERTIADAMVADQSQALRPEEYLWEVGRNLHLAPSNVNLSLLEAPNGPLAQRFDRDRRLARVLGAWQDRFDWCVIDCPPTIGLLTFNALRTADLVLIPVETGFFSLKGAEKQIQTIEAVVSRFGREIAYRLLPTMVNERRALSRDVVEALGRRFPEALLPFSIREHEELRDAASYGQSITEFAPGSAADADFSMLATWLRGNAPLRRVLEQYGSESSLGGVAPAPQIETFAPSAISQAMHAVSAVESANAHPAHHAHRAQHSDQQDAVQNVLQQVQSPSAGADRTADLVSRVRAMTDKARQVSTVGGGFGPRAQRDGVVVFSLPFSRHAASVVGDFNQWDPNATPFIESADQRRLEATVLLSAGTHAYRIVVNGEETLDGFNELRDDSIHANLVVVPAQREEHAGATPAEDRR